MSLLLPLLVFVSAASSPLQSPNELVGSERPRIPGAESYACYRTSRGFFLSSNKGTAAKMIGEIDRAAAIFKQQFNYDPPSGIVVEFQIGVDVPPSIPTKDLQLGWSLQVPSLGESFQTARLEQYRKQLESAQP